MDLKLKWYSVRNEKVSKTMREHGLSYVGECYKQGRGKKRDENERVLPHAVPEGDHSPNEDYGIGM